MGAGRAAGAMRVAWLCALCLASAPLAVGQQSTLKVAACNPGSVPYVDTDDKGKLIGYDIGTFCWTASVCDKLNPYNSYLKLTGLQIISV